MFIFRYLQLGSTPCLERLMEKGRNSPEMWKAGMLLWPAPPTRTQGRLQRDDTWRTAEEETETLFLNTHFLATHMT